MATAALAIMARKLPEATASPLPSRVLMSARLRRGPPSGKDSRRCFSFFWPFFFWARALVDRRRLRAPVRGVDSWEVDDSEPALLACNRG